MGRQRKPELEPKAFLASVGIGRTLSTKEESTNLRARRSGRRHLLYPTRLCQAHGRLQGGQGGGDFHPGAGQFFWRKVACAAASGCMSQALRPSRIARLCGWRRTTSPPCSTLSRPSLNSSFNMRSSARFASRRIWPTICSNNSEKRLARRFCFLSQLRKGRRTCHDYSKDQPGDAGGDCRHHSLED